MAIIAIDFDGTCVTHEFPLIGKDIGAVPVLKNLVKNGHQLILFTMRSDVVDPKGDGEIWKQSGPYLTAAVQWFKDHNIELWGINQNPKQYTWTSSPKPYAHIYIDGAALGVPLKTDFSLSMREFVDWEKVQELLIESGYLFEKA